ncbi:MAG TPA: hypothetical protein VH092_11000 [Urbifossiella sp.]|jgi:hypothetical protein|nr:hypothetical protein [Urbifossiella sp.]
MTEAEWLGATDPRPVLEALRGKASDRKLRLFGCACCRRVYHLLTSDRSRAAVVMAERYADGLATETEIGPFAGSALAGSDFRLPTARREAESAASQLCKLSPTFDAGYAAYFASSHAAIAMAHDVNRRSEHPAEVIGPALRIREEAEQVRVLRDIFETAFRPVSFDPSWRTEAAALARGVYEGRAFDHLPILADALEDAGCADPAVLAHCRGGGPHVRGCWVVDLVLGKE